MNTATVPPSPIVDLTEPHDLEAEHALLGCMLRDSLAVATAIETVKATDFYRPANSEIFAAIVDVYGSGVQVEPVTVLDALMKKDVLLRVGGGPFIHELIAQAGFTASVPFYAQRVTDEAQKRRLLVVGTRIMQMARSHDDVDSLINQSQAAVLDIARDHENGAYEPFDDILPRLVASLEATEANGGQIMGVPTGYIDLDATTNGLHPGQLIIIGGRPGDGKSLMAIDIARSAAFRHRHVTAFFSLEMSDIGIGERVMAAEANIPVDHMRDGKMTDAEWERFGAAGQTMLGQTLFLDQTPSITPSEILAKSRRIQQKHGLGLVIVDYLQLMKTGRRIEKRHEEVAEMTRALKLLARTLNVPVIAASQVNRGPSTRTDKRPTLADLRESGSIEQDADIVLLLHRPDQDGDAGSQAGEIHVLVAKNRRGATGTIKLAWQPHFGRLANMAAPPATYS